MYNVGFIPARAGSKGIKSKNLVPLNNKPLIWYTVSAAANSELEKVFVSTDSSDLKKIVENFGYDKVEVISRSKESASDNATSESALIEFCEQTKFDNVVFLQATSPMTTSNDINSGLKIFATGNYNSVISVVKNHQFLWDCNGNPINYNPQARPRRQDWDGYFIENGAFYISSRKNILNSKCRISHPVGYYEMNKKSLLEIDSKEDLELATSLLD